jgi:hypothetical protein
MAEVKGTKDSGYFGRFEWDKKSGSDMARAIKLAVERGAIVEEIDILLQACMIIDKYDLLYNLTLPEVNHVQYREPVKYKKLETKDKTGFTFTEKPETDTLVPELLFFDSGEEAQKILDSLIDIAKTYRYASVAAYYDLAAHRSTTRSVDGQFVWDEYDLARVEVNQFGTNYMLNLPEAKQIKKEEESK